MGTKNIYKNKVYEELKNVLLESEKPSVEIIEMIDEGKFENEPFNTIVELEKVKQNPKFHGEGNVLKHTLLVVDKASTLRKKSKNPEVFMISALLHDIGKIATTKIRKGNWTSYNHDIVSSEMIPVFLNGLESEKFIKDVSKLVLHHMGSLHFQKNKKNFSLENIVREVNIDDFILLTIADRTGRLGVDEKFELSQIKNFERELKRLQS